MVVKMKGEVTKCFKLFRILSFRRTSKPGFLFRQPGHLRQEDDPVQAILTKIRLAAERDHHIVGTSR